MRKWALRGVCVAARAVLSGPVFSEFPPARPLAYNAEHVKSEPSVSFSARGLAGAECHAVSPTLPSPPEVKELWREALRG